MPKSQFVDPAFMRRPGFIRFEDIPVNQYNKTIAQERENFTDQQLVRIFHDMAVIREFETMLATVKVKANYAGRDFTYPGPAHLSTGQESSAVGSAFLLGMDDYIFGNHRSHGEVIAKGLSAIELLSDSELMAIMQGFQNGTILSYVEKLNHTGSVKDLARDFLLFGAMSEIFARDCGFTRGMGGSMHMFFLPFGIYPNNAIVGGSAPVAAGAALFKKINKKRGIIVANAGDGSLGCGPVWESLNFAAMDQYRDLWEDGYKGGLPILFQFNDNHYGMGGQTRGETMAYGELARVGAGISPTQLHAERIDGYNPLAVIDAVRRKRPLLETGEGPVLLDIVTYRYAGHSTSDASSYRTKEELEAWQQVDPLLTYRKALAEAGVRSDSAFDSILDDVKCRMEKLFLVVTDEKQCPLPSFEKEPDFLERIMFSNQHIASMTGAPVEDMLLKKEDCPRVQQIAGKARYFKDESGKPVPKMKAYTLRDGLFEAILEKYYEDSSLIAYGEDVRDWGGPFAVYKGLTETVPYHRLFNSPISEAAICGSAVGYGLMGGRAIVELMYCDFIGRAGDEIFNQLAKWQAMSGGNLKMPVILRVSVGSKYAAQHSQDWTALCAHMPGLKVIFPATPYDAKGLLTTALNGTDPVVVLESQRIYDVGEQFHTEGVPEGHFEIPLGEPDIKREGSDITILTIGATLYRALQAAELLQEKYGVSAEVIDARSVVPFNYDLVVKSVQKTGRIVLASDACARGSILNDMAQKITDLCFDYLDAPPAVVGARNWITPPYEFDKYFFPQPSWILDVIHERILPLKGYIPGQNFSDMEISRRSREGV